LIRSQRGRAHLDVLHDSRAIVDGDLIAQAEGALQQQKEPGDEVLEDVLEGEAEGEGQKAEAAKHEGRTSEELGERRDDADDQRSEKDYSVDEQGDLRIGLDPAEFLPGQPSHQASEDVKGEDDEERRANLEEIPGGWQVTAERIPRARADRQHGA